MPEGDQHRQHREAEPGRAGRAGGADGLKLALIALGGAVGALSRYGLGSWVQSAAGPAFPLGTLVVNVSGCFLLGVLAGSAVPAAVSPDLRAGLAVGLLGAFTTFSTFSWEAIALAQLGAWPRAAAYVVGSLVLGLVAVAAGLWLSSVAASGAA